MGDRASGLPLRTDKRKLNSLSSKAVWPTNSALFAISPVTMIPTSALCGRRERHIRRDRLRVRVENNERYAHGSRLCLGAPPPAMASLETADGDPDPDPIIQTRWPQISE